ncbi:MAG: hypothetical protein COZ49_02530 [Candidatus Yonathbacteria bacterium CG_4_10_14_3_um_filter_47_65]|uniref:Uncharacterized protein n=2 Tax=Parcubacteria group TaxID=1794811 RepID=A0A2M8D688_9BACT|nr:MAG: hypothetical protein AUJ44_01695 [Candidatus Nomurabacteria bacterium CG1_02_47_685]PIP03584.1 MAG: hypothetical protein COX54_03055 [Candidatus Yonathbacteria bacterium CG23_combo_of_CG06-09_8_20_14_all_46_18]PIQ31405.1 MAG: hypothetical protein COW61_03790 [Candidatus Yonathbacteria bacterium CG17_big_fil_post_rev_8_21_14_2_50_46_19]PIX56362.1 MAG: hypothetical protein COZ49_02530 [Candidatus Yonathbacteria bacterium CG_4_10_14_3_um_filter_47_65]PIY57510.1 MAG: hypothetical protein CO
MNTPRNTGGFLKLIVVLIIVIVTLSYFSFDLKTITESSAGQWVMSHATYAWGNYLYPAGGFLWDKVIVGFVWVHVASFFGVDTATSPDGSSLATSTLDVIAM